MIANTLKTDIQTVGKLTSRNLRIFLKDKAAVFFSLLAPLIVLLLYVLFLGDIQVDSVKGSIPNGISVDEKAIKAFVDCWMVAGVLATACITVSLSANAIMIQDKTRGVINDALSAPVKRSVITFSYFLFNFIVTSIIVLLVLFVCFIYLAATGSFYLSAGETFALIGTVFFSSLSATLITVFMCSFFNSEAAFSGFIGIVSAVLGFLIGAYMPLSIMPVGVQYFSALFPGSHSAGLFRNLLMQGALDNLSVNLPQIAVDNISQAFSMKVNFFGLDIGADVMAVYTAAFVVLFFAINMLLATRKHSVFLQQSKKTSRKNIEKNKQTK